MSLLRIVASSSAFFLPASPPPKASSIDSDWSTKNKKQPGFLRLISAWYAMVSLRFWHHDSLFRGALARELSQSSQSDLDIACAKFHRIVEIPVLPLVPDLDRGSVARAFLPDADALGVVAMRATRRI